LNVLDQVVSDGNKHISNVENDIREIHELTSKNKLPTPVTTGSIRGSKIGRKVKYQNLKILTRHGLFKRKQIRIFGVAFRSQDGGIRVVISVTGSNVCTVNKSEILMEMGGRSQVDASRWWGRVIIFSRPMRCQLGNSFASCGTR